LEHGLQLERRSLVQLAPLAFLRQDENLRQVLGILFAVGSARRSLNLGREAIDDLVEHLGRDLEFADGHHHLVGRDLRLGGRLRRELDCCRRRRLGRRRRRSLRHHEE
jgi:hypothetical protein